MDIKELQKDVHRVAKEKGWHDQERTVPMFIANTHRELSEAFQKYTTGEGTKPYTCVDFHNPPSIKPEGYGIELADVILRILDEAELRNIDMEECLKHKHEYNKTRSYRHGNKIV